MKNKMLEKHGDIKFAVNLLIYMLYTIIIPIILYDMFLIIHTIINPNSTPDIFGYKTFSIVSGSMGAMIAIYASANLNINNTLTALLISSIISSIMVGGKAIGKNIAVKKSDEIIFMVGSIISKFTKENKD